MVQCNQTGSLPKDTLIATDQTSQSIPFFEVFYELDDIKSGYHHPDGMLWVRFPDRTHVVHKERVSLRSIAPTLLQMLGVARPDFMKCDPFIRKDVDSPEVAPTSDRRLVQSEV
jgi:hypothetical protein